MGQREELDLNAQLVDHDALTGLLNRRGVFDVLSGAVARQEVGCLLLFDLDDFKLVNDHHGHGGGDHVLQVVSDRLRAATRPTDAVGRLSGDEFVVLLRDIDLGGALEVAERTIGYIEQVIAIPHAAVSISASVGVATIADRAHRAGAHPSCGRRNVRLPASRSNLARPTSKDFSMGVQRHSPGSPCLPGQADPDSTAWYDYEITTDRSRVNTAARRLLREL